MYISKERSCDGKRPYSKRSKAKRMMDSLIAKGVDNRKYEDVRLAYYKCPYCKSFHVGHKPKRRD